MADQLTFDLPSVPALGREAFFISPANAVAVSLLENTKDWSSGKMLLCGPAKSGKTHLAHVWADQTGAALIDASTLPVTDIVALAAHSHLIVEDIDLTRGHATCGPRRAG